MMKYLRKLSDRQLSFWVGLFVFFAVLLIFLPVVLFRVYLVVNSGEAHYTQMEANCAVFTFAILVLGLVLFIGTNYFSRSLIKARRATRRYLERFQAVVDQSRDAMLLITKDFRILEINPASRDLLGLETGQTQIGFLKSLLNFRPPLDENLLLQLCQNNGISEHQCVRRDGMELIIEVSASQIPDAEIQAFSLTLHDVTAQKKAENALRVSEERYMLAANGSNDGLWDWNLMNGVTHYSARWKAMLGFTEDEIKSTSDEWFHRVHPEDVLQLHTRLSDHLRNRDGHFECEYRIAAKDGAYRWMLARGMAVWDPAGYAHRIAGSQTDITEQKRIEAQLRHDALHDALTGLANRTLLLQHLKQANERKKRKPDRLFALFFLDLNRFKHVNDSLGHQAGDQLLIEVAHRLEAGFRSVDTVARFSVSETLARIAGDEFVILLEDFSSREDICKVADRISQLLAVPFRIAGIEVILAASIGVVIPEQAYEVAEDIIRDADIAMYQAKQQGCGLKVFHPEMYQQSLQRIHLENELRQAVERHEFSVYYQPIFSLQNDRIAGFEALVRWNHPSRGLLMPSEFIHIAEETGLIVPIGYFVLEEACRKMCQWSEASQISSEMIVSVNFSTRQLIHSDLVENVRSILSKTGFAPTRLWVEVTENIFLEKNEIVIKQFHELRAMGIRIEIDDFGTGYSSLSYLQNLPIDGFKIDRSFINDVHGEGQYIVKTLVDLGHNLGLTEVAEGVETSTQKEYLQTISCDYAQGFYMASPVSAAAMEDFLHASSR